MSVAFVFQIFYAGYDGKNEGILIETELFSQPDPLFFICGETFRVDAAVTDEEMIFMEAACQRVPPDVFTDADDCPLVRIMDAPSLIRRSASPRSLAPQTNGTLNWCLSIW